MRLDHFLLICALIAPLVLLGQSLPTEYAKAAQKHMKAGALAAAIHDWKQDYRTTKDHWNAYEIAAAYALQQKPDSCFAWLLKGAIADSSLDMLLDDRFYGITHTKQWELFEFEQIRKYELSNGKLKNLPLTISLLHIGMKDQAYSYEINLAQRTLGDTSPISVVLQKFQLKNRQENLSEIEEIIEKSGWPKISEVSKNAVQSAFYVIQHAEQKEARRKYITALKVACEINEAPWEYYATMYDRLSLEETGKQLYGTQFTRDGYNGTIQLSPLEAPEYVEKRRKEIGLPSLLPKLERLGIVFEVGQKE